MAIRLTDKRPGVKYHLSENANLLSTTRNPKFGRLKILPDDFLQKSQLPKPIPQIVPVFDRGCEQPLGVWHAFRIAIQEISLLESFPQIVVA